MEFNEKQTLEMTVLFRVLKLSSDVAWGQPCGEHPVHGPQALTTQFSLHGFPSQLVKKKKQKVLHECLLFYVNPSIVYVLIIFQNGVAVWKQHEKHNSDFTVVIAFFKFFLNNSLQIYSRKMFFGGFC